MSGKGYPANGCTPSMLPGTYFVTVTASGFRIREQSGMLLKGQR